ncbi:RloB family protein [Flaviaesturariibacter aridisoli]|nr:RloB family protein [Flaviaesturariibacter aridisoli]
MEVIEPWDLQADSVRSSDTVNNVIIFCEDDAVEPTYFQDFGTPNLHVSINRNYKQHHFHVDAVVEHFRAIGMLEFVDGVERLKIDEGSYVWCVFDRDKAPDKADAAFNLSIRNAEDMGVRVAWSNDNFELWLLLHFENVPLDNPTFEHRDTYYGRLTEIVAEGPAVNSAHQAILNQIAAGAPTYSYYNWMKSESNFKNVTRHLLTGLTSDAIQRARALHDHFSTPARPPHQMMPCTLVYQLVEQLLSLQ